jgi:hypothetical protein
LTDTTLPDPLVPAEVDLRDFQGMWIDTDRLLKSESWQLGTSDEKAAAMTLWLESWHQVPAASLPANDRMLGKLAQAERWAKSKEGALRNWVACSDGRLYHPVVAEKALEAWIEKLAAAINGAVGNAKRWNIVVDADPMRDQLRHAASLLRALNPASRTFKKKAVLVILSGSQADSPPDPAPESGADSPPDTPKASPPDRKGPDQTGPDQTGPSSLPPPVVGAAEPVAKAPAPTRGTRLPTDWALPKAWGDWALAEFPQWTSAKVRTEAANFADHWHGLSGKDATKVDWLATWRKWCRNPLAHRDDAKPNGHHPQSFAERTTAAKAARYAEMTRGLLGTVTPIKPTGETIDMEASDGAPRLLA